MRTAPVTACGPTRSCPRFWPADAGHAILLHDAGGDRSATVKALPVLIDALRARGYRLTTIGGLVGRTPEQTMPSLPPGERSLIAADSAAFGFSHAVGSCCS